MDCTTGQLTLERRVRRTRTFHELPARPVIRSQHDCFRSTKVVTKVVPSRGNGYRRVGPITPEIRRRIWIFFDWLVAFFLYFFFFAPRSVFLTLVTSPSCCFSLARFFFRFVRHTLVEETRVMSQEIEVLTRHLSRVSHTASRCQKTLAWLLENTACSVAR